MPSCIRAPPLAEKMIRGSLCFWAYSTARVIFSPTATPMLAMKKRLSSTANTAWYPSSLPVAATAASGRAVFSRWAASLPSYPGKSSTLGAVISGHSSRKLKGSSSRDRRR